MNWPVRQANFINRKKYNSYKAFVQMVVYGCFKQDPILYRDKYFDHVHAKLYLYKSMARRLQNATPMLYLIDMKQYITDCEAHDVADSAFLINHKLRLIGVRRCESPLYNGRDKSRSEGK
jgi:hypothetical protein